MHIEVLFRLPRTGTKKIHSITLDGSTCDNSSILVGQFSNSMHDAQLARLDAELGMLGAHDLTHSAGRYQL